MQSGKLNRRVTLQSQSATPDTYGAPALTWTDFATVWAHVSPVTGRESFAGQALYAEVDYQILIRYRTGVVAKMRAVYGGGYYDIQAVIDKDQDHRLLNLLCKSGLTDG